MPLRLPDTIVARGDGFLQTSATGAYLAAMLEDWRDSGEMQGLKLGGKT
jgi:hypothetical protein